MHPILSELVRQYVDRLSAQAIVRPASFIRAGSIVPSGCEVDAGKVFKIVLAPCLEQSVLAALGQTPIDFINDSHQSLNALTASVKLRIYRFTNWGRSCRLGRTALGY